MNNRYMNSCGCDHPDSASLCLQNRQKTKSLAMAYVPWQKWQNVMDGCSVLKHGTIFEELVLPFEGSPELPAPNLLAELRIIMTTTITGGV